MRRSDGVFFWGVTALAVVLHVRSSVADGATTEPQQLVLAEWLSPQVEVVLPVPFTGLRLELSAQATAGVRRRVVPRPRTIQDYVKHHPTRTILYGVSALCAPRLTLLWALALDPDPLALLQSAHSGTGPSIGGRAYWHQWLFTPGLLVAQYGTAFMRDCPVRVAFTWIVGAMSLAVDMALWYRAACAVLSGSCRAFARCFTFPNLAPVLLVGQWVTTLACVHLCAPRFLASPATLAMGVCLPLLSLLLQVTTAWDPTPREAPVNQPAIAMEAPPGAVPPRHHGRQHAPAAHLVATGQQYWPPAIEVPPELRDAENVPRAFVCPITHELMRQPAVTASGASYEHAAITEWLASARRDPLTGRQLELGQELTPNIALRAAIIDWVELHKADATAATAVLS